MPRKAKKAEETVQETEVMPQTEETVEEAQPEAEQLQEQTVDTSNGTVIASSGAVYFRTGASFNKAVIAELKPGAPVKVLGSQQGDKGVWYKCEYQGRTGFVKATGLKFGD